MARRITKPAAPTSVQAVRHTGDSRVNIPTAELGGLAQSEEAGPPALRHPRDPSLDPQLVWRGKDEQDGDDLMVPAVPVHIQDDRGRPRWPTGVLRVEELPVLDLRATPPIPEEVIADRGHHVCSNR